MQTSSTAPVAASFTTSESIPLQRSFGRGALTISNENGRNRLSELIQEGCAKIRLPQGLAHATEEAVLINTSGGITGGDRLQWKLRLENDAAFRMTTQACEKIYGASGSSVASTDIRIDIGDRCSLAWLPQETILYDEAALERRLDIKLGKNAELLLVEPVVFGRTAMKETMRCGVFRDSWRIWQEGRLLHAEEFHVHGDVEAKLSGPASMCMNRAMATVLLISPDLQAHISRLATHSQTHDSVAWSYSAFDDKLLVRFLAHDSYELRKGLVPILELLSGNRPLPKVWAL
jgi:urease accessory protein